MSYAVLKVQRMCMISSYPPERKLVLPVSSVSYQKNATKYKLSSPRPRPGPAMKDSIVYTIFVTLLYSLTAYWGHFQTVYRETFHPH